MMSIRSKKKEKSSQTMDEKLNSLRAGVLGSNDGILTVVGVLFSVAVATTNQFTIFIAGLSDLLACAFSMASGEYASVSTQKDTEQSVVMKEKELLKTNSKQNLQTVSDYYVDQGVTRKTADKIAADLMKKKPLETIINIKYDLQLGHYMNLGRCFFITLFSSCRRNFPAGSHDADPGCYQWQATILAVCLSVALTGFMSAKLGNGLVKTAMIRNVLVGIITMIIHYSLGILLQA